VDVEHAALTARVTRRFAFVDDRVDAVYVQHPGKGNVLSAACWCGSGQNRRIDRCWPR
jgi:hypothetical protein